MCPDKDGCCLKSNGNQEAADPAQKKSRQGCHTAEIWNQRRRMAYKLLIMLQMRSSRIPGSIRLRKAPGYMILLCALLACLSTGCREEYVPAPYLPSNDHEAYIHSLRLAGMADTSLAKD